MLAWVTALYRPRAAEVGRQSRQPAAAAAPRQTPLVAAAGGPHRPVGGPAMHMVSGSEGHSLAQLLEQ